MIRAALLSVVLIAAAAMPASSAEKVITVTNKTGETLGIGAMLRMVRDGGKWAFGIGQKQVADGQTIRIEVPDRFAGEFQTADVYADMDRKKHGGSAAGCRIEGAQANSRFVVVPAKIVWCRFER